MEVSRVPPGKPSRTTSAGTLTTRAGFTYRLYKLKPWASCSKGAFKKLWYTQGLIQGGRLGRSPPLKLTKVTLFTMILYNSERHLETWLPNSTEIAPHPYLTSWIRPCVRIESIADTGIWSFRQLFIKILCLNYSWNVIFFTYSDSLLITQGSCNEFLWIATWPLDEPHVHYCVDILTARWLCTVFAELYRLLRVNQAKELVTVCVWNAPGQSIKVALQIRPMWTTPYTLCRASKLILQ